MANGSAVRITQVQSGRNAAIVESAYDALNIGNIKVLKRLFHEHASWHTPATWELLRAHGVAVAWTEWRELPRVEEVTAPFLYLRWLGDRRDIEKYDRVQVDRTDSFTSWEAALMRTLGDVREVFGYFNNHWAGHSPASANEMKKRLGLATVEPRDRWAQRELF